MTLKFLEGKSVLILGFAREGKALLEYLKRHGEMAQLGVADRSEELDVKGTKLHLGVDYLESLQNYDVIFKSPGHPWTEELEAVKERVSSSTQLFFDELHESNTVIAVTGSKGKSTVSTILFRSLKEAGKKVLLLGNIGEPMLKHVSVKGHFLVVELSSFQLEHLEFNPKVSVVTRLFPEHLDRHGAEEHYYRAKSHVTSGQEASGALIYHQREESVIQQWPGQAKRVCVEEIFSFDHEAFYEMHGKKRESVLPMSCVKIPGLHNRENIALVLGAFKALDLPYKAVEKALVDFKGVTHRLQSIGVVRGIEFVDDAISTNPGSAMAALEVYEERVGTLFLGGLDRGLDFKPLIRKIAELKVENVVLFPDSGLRILREWEEMGLPLPRLLTTRSMEEAVSFAFKHTAPGKVCLLSTASPSQSIWKDYEEKGNLFAHYVLQHGHKAPPKVDRLHELDFIRTLTILLILILHFNSYFPMFSWVGPAIFFQSYLVKAGHFFFFISGMMSWLRYKNSFSKSIVDTSLKLWWKALSFFFIFTAYLVAVRWLSGDLTLEGLSLDHLYRFYTEHRYFNTILVIFAALYFCLPPILLAYRTPKIGHAMPLLGASITFLLTLANPAGSAVEAVDSYALNQFFFSAYYPFTEVLFIFFVGSFFAQLYERSHAFKPKHPFTMIVFSLIAFIFGALLDTYFFVAVPAPFRVLGTAMSISGLIVLFSFFRPLIEKIPMGLGRESLVAYVLMNLFIVLGNIYFQESIMNNATAALIFLTLLLILFSELMGWVRARRKKDSNRVSKTT